MTNMYNFGKLYMYKYIKELACTYFIIGSTCNTINLHLYASIIVNSSDIDALGTESSLAIASKFDHLLYSDAIKILE